MWTYEQSTGWLIDSAGKTVAKGYSGAPEGENDPAKQQVSNVGPIPRGGYSIGEPFHSTARGPCCLSLSPAESNEMFERSGFLIHGDSKEHPGAASHGCIILPRTIRERIWASGDHDLKVT